jgi:hypothetical protein
MVPRIVHVQCSLFQWAHRTPPLSGRYKIHEPLGAGRGLAKFPPGGSLDRKGISLNAMVVHWWYIALTSKIYIAGIQE